MSEMCEDPKVAFSWNVETAFEICSFPPKSSLPFSIQLLSEAVLMNNDKI